MIYYKHFFYIISPRAYPYPPTPAQLPAIFPFAKVYEMEQNILAFGLFLSYIIRFIKQSQIRGEGSVEIKLPGKGHILHVIKFINVDTVLHFLADVLLRFHFFLLAELLHIHL